MEQSEEVQSCLSARTAIRPTEAGHHVRLSLDATLTAVADLDGQISKAVLGILKLDNERRLRRKTTATLKKYPGVHALITPSSLGPPALNLKSSSCIAITVFLPPYPVSTPDRHPAPPPRLIPLFKMVEVDHFLDSVRINQTHWQIRRIHCPSAVLPVKMDLAPNASPEYSLLGANFRGATSQGT
ncbi:hypothetical protein FB451DRAFT_1172711 [Mycena latifolia]|nr:hypothetical protein FB451DRAFT_1172711 [Mycena latifolia]